jgi:hypothetical protein
MQQAMDDSVLDFSFLEEFSLDYIKEKYKDEQISGEFPFQIYSIILSLGKFIFLN